MQVTREIFEAVQEIAELQGMYANAYSGRGMYGTQCLGVVGTLQEFVRFTLRLSAAALDEDHPQTDGLMELIVEMQTSRTSTDSMGLDTVFYWPSAEIVA